MDRLISLDIAISELEEFKEEALNNSDMYVKAQSLDRGELRKMVANQQWNYWEGKKDAYTELLRKLRKVKENDD